MKGKIILYKGTGKVLFTFNTKAFIIDDLRRTNPEIGNKINLNHKLKSLTFGEVAQHIHILLRFGASDHTNFDMVKMVDDDIYANDEQRKDYFYFLKLVPHIFVDEINDDEFRSYSYSLNHNSKQS